MDKNRVIWPTVVCMDLLLLKYASNSWVTLYQKWSIYEWRAIK